MSGLPRALIRSIQRYPPLAAVNDTNDGSSDVMLKLVGLALLKHVLTELY